MLIGVDIDNTLNDFSNYLGLPQKELEQNVEKIFGDTPLKDKYVTTVIEELFHNGHGLHILTNRYESVNMPIIDLTGRWLDKHGLTKYFKSIRFVNGCKYTFSKLEYLYLDVMIEDSLERALPFLEKGVPVILFSYPYNEGYEHKLLYRVYNWLEVYLIINYLSNK